MSKNAMAFMTEPGYLNTYRDFLSDISDVVPRTLLLTFVHGFKGSDTHTFHDFPNELRDLLRKSLPDVQVETVVYPKYETSGDLATCTSTFLTWLKEHVITIRKRKNQNLWPPRDRSVGVILCAHSMGGLVASDAIFSVLDARAADADGDAKFMFPLVQGLLAFDTPYDGLARSMFVYGAFSQYQKVSGLWNVMSAASAGILSAGSLGSLGKASKAAGRASKAASSSLLKNPGWKAWQAVAIRSGTVGIIACGGITAYMHREAIIKGVKGLNKESIKQTCSQSYDAIGQGLAYINRDSVGQSFAWLSSHLKFIGCLMKRSEMSQRLVRLDGLQGIGIKNFYTSRGENGYWSGGYFVPERTFCAVPAKGQLAEDMFVRNVNTLAEDEVDAHMGMFQPSTNSGYEKLLFESSILVKSWFLDETEVQDTKPFVPLSDDPDLEGSEKYPIIIEDDDDNVPTIEGAIATETTDLDDSMMEDESPLDLVATAAAIPLPEDDDAPGTEKQTYLRNLMRIANSAGSGVRGMVWKSKSVEKVVEEASTKESNEGTVRENEDVKVEEQNTPQVTKEKDTA